MVHYFKIKAWSFTYYKLYIGIRVTVCVYELIQKLTFRFKDNVLRHRTKVLYDMSFILILEAY